MAQSSFALITGCSSGIGRDLAIAFAEKGVTVLATARRVESLEGLTSRYNNIEAFALELSDLKGIEKLKDAVTKRTDGHIDFLINNAGKHYAATALDLEVDEIFVPLLCQSPRGRLVQIGSVTRDVPVVWQSAYNASKSALSQYTKTLRLELKPFGVEVIEVVTGFVRSNILHHGLHAPQGSLYLPIKGVIGDIKYNGNANGMSTDVYARSVVRKLMRPRTSTEIWEGKLALLLRFLVTFLPLQLLDWILFRRFKLSRLNDSPGT